MNMSALFIKRPVTTTLLMLGILVFGGLAYQVLPVADLPSVDFPSIRVQASLPGASPETMAASVALPLEKQFTSIAGVTSFNAYAAVRLAQLDSGAFIDFVGPRPGVLRFNASGEVEVARRSRRPDDEDWKTGEHSP